MGVVYAALDTELDREIALKLVRPRTDVGAMQERLRREGKAMARLSHRNVVPVFDSGRHDGQLFLAMELIAGETLRTWVKTRRPWREVARVFAMAGRGLAAAHEAEVLHRDFKPDNVIIDRDGEPRITDFGLARELGVEAAVSTPAVVPDNRLAEVTAPGAIAGTPGYIPPEHLRGARGDAKADQFTFCVSLFEVLYGIRPFGAAGLMPDEWLAAIRDGRIAKPMDARAVPSWLHAVAVRGLAFDPAQRWPSMGSLVEALERGLHRRRRRFNMLVAFLALTAIAVLVIATRPRSCRAVSREGTDAATIPVCREEYARTKDPQAGQLLADALRRTGNLRDATIVANELLVTPARGDALYTLGKIAGDEDRPADAARLLRLAREAHRDQQRWVDAAADLLAASRYVSDFVDQLADLDQAASDARRARTAAASEVDRAAAAKTEAYSHLAAAIVFSRVGRRASALRELAHAEPLLTVPADRIGLDLERGNVHQNLGEHALAIAAFGRALESAQTATIARRVSSARLNLAYSLAELGRLEEAVLQLKAASELDARDDKLPTRLSIEAQIAVHAGDPVRAAELVERALALLTKDASEARLELEVQRAEIALRQGDLDAAESWAGRAIDRIEQLRSTNPPAELRSWMTVDRRIPYEILFASHARRGDAWRALGVFDGYHGLGVLASLAREEPAPAMDGAGKALARDVASPIAELQRLLLLLQASPLATPASDQTIRDAVQAGSLLVIVAARGELWRITADAGRLQIAHIGALATLRPQLERLHVAPGDRAVAAELGARLVPVELARATDSVLRVVLDEPLASLPVAALRVGDRTLISLRPIVRAARVSAASCAPRSHGPRRTVLLDTSMATRSSLRDVARDDRLHLAVPITRDALGEALAMSDGRVRALEIAGRGGAPAQVVLTESGADSAGTTSLAMAFVAAGADQVIATVRPVSSIAIKRITDRLARPDSGDLVQLLAGMQRAVDGDGDGDMLGFAVFGRATCDINP
jgi:tetratricopeptide (TPR) repeat protein